MSYQTPFISVDNRGVAAALVNYTPTPDGLTSSLNFTSQNSASVNASGNMEIEIYIYLLMYYVLITIDVANISFLIVLQ